MGWSSMLDDVIAYSWSVRVKVLLVDCKSTHSVSSSRIFPIEIPW